MKEKSKEGQGNNWKQKIYRRNLINGKNLEISLVWLGFMVYQPL